MKIIRLSNNESEHNVVCKGCGHSFNYDNQPEVSMGATACPNCGSHLNQEGTVLGESASQKNLSFSWGTTPDNVIQQQTLKETPGGYPMEIRSQREWAAIANAVNKGIDAHLEGFTRSKFDPSGHCLVHPEEMKTLLRRLLESGDEEAEGLRSAILTTLNIEEI